MKLIENGLAKCKYEPRGDWGLEGYQRGQLYKYELIDLDGKKRFKVYPEAEVGYGEYCSKTIFNKCFEIITQATF